MRLWRRVFFSFNLTYVSFIIEFGDMWDLKKRRTRGFTKKLNGQKSKI